MAGILGDLFGGQAPTPGLLDAAGYMDPAQYDAARRNQGMMGLWAGLLAGGGPSLEPRNFGSALGAGFAGQNQFGSKFDEDQLHASQAAQARANVGKLGKEAELYGIVPGLIKDFMSGGGSGSGGAPGGGSTGGAPAAPGAGGAVPNFGGAYKGEGDPASLVKHFESGGNYNIGYGGIDLSNAPRDQYGFPQWAGKDNSHAAGAYQFQPGTWARYAAPLGIKDFSQESQDKVFAAAFAAEGWKPWAPYNPRLAAEVARRTAAGAGERTTAAGGVIPDFTEGRAAALGGPVPAMLAAGAAPAPALLPRPGGDPNAPPLPSPGPPPADYTAPLAGNARRGGPAPPTQRQGGKLVTEDQFQYPYTPGGSGGGAPRINIEQLAGLAAPAGDVAAVPAGQQFGVGGALSRTMGLPIPAAAVAPAPSVPAPAPTATQPPAAAAAPPPGATQPPGAPRAPVPMPGAITAPPLSAAQAPAPMAGASSDQRVRAAQGLSLALSVLGKTVPGFIGDIAGLPVAGQKAALEAAAKQPYLLQMEAYKQMGELQKTEYSHALGLDKSRLDSELARYNDLYGKGGVFNPQTGQVEPVPGMSETQAAAAGAKKAAEDAATRTQDQKEYDSYVKQETAAGRPPLSQFEYLQNLKRAGAASTVINTAEGLAAAQQKARLDIDTKAAKDAGEIAAAARRTAPLLDEVLRIAHSTPSGWAGPISLRMSQALTAAGLPVNQGMSNAEVMRSMNQLLIPTVREPGSSSNADVNNYLAATPGLMNSPEGRVKMASMIKAMGSRAGEIAAIYRNNVGAADLHEKLAALDAKPLFTDQQRADIEQAAGGGVTKRNSDGSWTTPSGAIVREVR